VAARKEEKPKEEKPVGALGSIMVRQCIRLFLPLTRNLASQDILARRAVIEGSDDESSSEDEDWD